MISRCADAKLTLLPILPYACAALQLSCPSAPRWLDRSRCTPAAAIKRCAYSAARPLIDPRRKLGGRGKHANGPMLKAQVSKKG
jgi:hypothetical protein